MITKVTAHANKLHQNSNRPTTKSLYWKCTCLQLQKQTYIYISIHAQSCFHLIYVSHMEKHMHMHTLAHSYTLNDIHTLMVVLKGHCIESLAYSCAWAGQDKISVQRLVKIQTHKRLRITLFIRTKHNMQIFRVSPLLSYKMTLKQQTVKNNEKWDGQLIHLSFLGWAMSSPETVSLKGW